MEQRTYYYGVDMVRFGCAMAVAVFHIGFSCWAAPASGGAGLLQQSYALPEIAWLVWPGWVGVEIFFVISGFVISSSAAGASPTDFLKGRMLRLYPAAWICTTLTMILLIAEGAASKSRYVASMALIPTGPWISGQYWTLGVEIMFYATVMSLLILRKGHAIFLLAAALGIASAVFTVTLALGLQHRFDLTVGNGRLTLLNYGADFALGIVFHAMASGRMTRWLWVLAAICVVGVVAEIHEHARRLSDITVNAPFKLIDYWYFAAALFFAGVTAIYLSIRWCERFAALSPRIRQLLRHLGLATYPLYLIHFFLGVVMTRELVRLGMPAMGAFVLTLAALTALSIGIAVWIEPGVRRPLRKLLDRVDRAILKQPRPEPAS